jgi:hypothetical protein
MDTIQKTILISLISIAAISWLFSNYQPDMMKAMMTYDPIAVSLFTISWTVGMAAIMFPSITPIVLLYNRLIRAGGDGRDNTKDGMSHALVVEWDESPRRNLPLPIFHPFLNIIFVVSYLAIWAITGIVLLLGWSILMNNLLTHFETRQQFQIVYGIIMIISGIYQFTSLKRKCLGYCESPRKKVVQFNCTLHFKSHSQQISYQRLMIRGVTVYRSVDVYTVTRRRQNQHLYFLWHKVPHVVV